MYPAYPRFPRLRRLCCCLWSFEVIFDDCHKQVDHPRFPCVPIREIKLGNGRSFFVDQKLHANKTDEELIVRANALYLRMCDADPTNQTNPIPITCN